MRALAALDAVAQAQPGPEAGDVRRAGVLQRDQQLVSHAVAPQADTGADGQPALPAGAAAQLRDGLLGELLFLLAPLGAFFVGHRDVLLAISGSSQGTSTGSAGCGACAAKAAPRRGAILQAVRPRGPGSR